MLRHSDDQTPEVCLFSLAAWQVMHVVAAGVMPAKHCYLWASSAKTASAPAQLQQPVAQMNEAKHNEPAVFQTNSWVQELSYELPGELEGSSRPWSLRLRLLSAEPLSRASSLAGQDYSNVHINACHRICLSSATHLFVHCYVFLPHL